MDRYSDRRSPDRDRARYQPQIDSYIPSTSNRARPRERSPGSFDTRHQTDTWRGRPRSPSRGDGRIDTYAPREARPRSPRREYVQPDPRFDDPNRAIRDRSPPPAKRERVASPPREYGRPPGRSPPRRPYSPPRDGRAASFRPRSRSPRREERVDPYAVKTWRQRSPSPRSARPGGDSGRNSGSNSRHLSPRPYGRQPSEPYPLEPARTGDYRSPRTRSPPMKQEPPYVSDMDPYSSRGRMPDDLPNGNGYPPPRRDSETPVDYRDRPPPSGPGGYRDYAPSGPASGPISMSAHSRGGYPTGPSYPRGGYGGGYRGRGGYPAGGRGDFSGGYRGRGGPPGGYGRGAPPPDPYPPRDPAAPIPRRESSSGYGAGMGFRGSSNSTSMTYPRTQRFNQALSDLPQEKEGGQKLPPVQDTAKADKLEEEAARLRKLIDEKEAKKRAGLKEWERLERESSTASLRSELAEEHLRQLNGEGEGMAAAF